MSCGDGLSLVGAPGELIVGDAGGPLGPRAVGPQDPHPLEGLGGGARTIPVVTGVRKGAGGSGWSVWGEAGRGGQEGRDCLGGREGGREGGGRGQYGERELRGGGEGSRELNKRRNKYHSETEHALWKNLDPACKWRCANPLSEKKRGETDGSEFAQEKGDVGMKKMQISLEKGDNIKYR